MNFKKIAKDIAKNTGVNVTFKIDNNGHAWAFVGNANINVAVGRNRGYSCTGKAADRVRIFVKDDINRAIRAGIINGRVWK
jgi:hypothetical protein